MFNLIIYITIIPITTGIAYGDAQYLTVHKRLVTWGEAQLQCQQEGGVLASPINGEMLKAMKGLMSNDRMYHIGTRAGYTPGTYVSIEGVPLNNMTDVMDNMIQELDPENGDCLAMDQHSVRLVPCWTRLLYMCSEKGVIQNNIDAICGLNNKYDGYEYKMESNKCFKVHSTVSSWDQGAAKCTSEGGQLATIENENDKQALMALYSFTSYNWVFVGLRDYGGGDWKAMDGRLVENLYNDWEGCLKPKDSSRPCGTMNKTGKLDALSCGDSRHFICERKPFFKSHAKV